MKSWFKKISGSLFVLATLSFLLPFVAASCNGQELVQLTGLELVTGAKVQSPSTYGYGYTSNREVAPEPFAIIAVVVALSGIAFAFIKETPGNILSVISAAAAFVSLSLLQSKLNSEAAKEGANIFQIHYLAGFWIALILLAIALVFNIYLLANRRKAIEPGTQVTG